MRHEQSVSICLNVKNTLRGKSTAKNITMELEEEIQTNLKHLRGKSSNSIANFCTTMKPKIAIKPKIVVMVTISHHNISII